MAEIEYIQEHPVSGNSDFMLITWPGMANGDTGKPFIRSEYCDRSIQVEGTYGAAGTVLVQGCNESTPVNWRTLNDPYSNAITITTPKIEAITELVVAIRPYVSSGDGTTDLTVSMLVRKNSR